MLITKVSEERKEERPHAGTRRSGSSHARFAGLLGAWFVAMTIAACGQASANADYRRAEALIRSHDWDGGLALLQPILQVGPRTPKVLNLTGLAYTGKGDRAQADQYFRLALQADPQFVPALKNLGINEAALGEDGEAQRDLEAAARLAPADNVVNLYLGEIYYRGQDFKKAAAHLGQAKPFLDRDPDLLARLGIAELKGGEKEAGSETLHRVVAASLNPQMQLSSGVALAQAGLSERAIPYLEAAHLSYVDSADVSYDLALCYVAAKRYADSIRVLQALSMSGHDNAQGDDLLAEAYEANDDTAHAVASLRRSIALDPKDEDSYIEFASLCIDHQDFANAGKVLEVGLATLPRSSRLMFERGILNAMQNHYEAAEKDLQSAANLAPQDNAAYIGLGVTFLETGDTARAIPLLRSRLKEQPQDANLSYLLGEALRRSSAQQGDAGFQEAQKYLEQAVRLDPKLVEPHLSLGIVYLAEGRLQDAVAQLEMARDLDPTANSAYSHLAIAYRRLGQTEKSGEALRQLQQILDRKRNVPQGAINGMPPVPDSAAIDRLPR